MLVMFTLYNGTEHLTTELRHRGGGALAIEAKADVAREEVTIRSTARAGYTEGRRSARRHKAGGGLLRHHQLHLAEIAARRDDSLAHVTKQSTRTVHGRNHRGEASQRRGGGPRSIVTQRGREDHTRTRRERDEVAAVIRDLAHARLERGHLFIPYS